MLPRTTGADAQAANPDEQKGDDGQITMHGINHDSAHTDFAASKFNLLAGGSSEARGGFSIRVSA
ncbi:hypothetical protein CEE69_06755 [Rhodopirellula bahusiensis]|uniref:Uncharacterized protein n=1 Tax=Rhodopirellula bahusiensis TaxID=2014065 RepID=A0A2G1WA52_9BACT|nr:hypothetical protein CEE69_06755 [Rhodopirellula bahusiensis]